MTLDDVNTHRLIGLRLLEGYRRRALVVLDEQVYRYVKTQHFSIVVQIGLDDLLNQRLSGLQASCTGRRDTPPDLLPRQGMNLDGVSRNFDDYLISTGSHEVTDACADNQSNN